MKRHLTNRQRATRIFRNSFIVLIIAWLLFFLVSANNTDLALFFFGAR